MLKFCLFSFIFISKNLRIEEDSDSDPDFGGFIKNMFSKMFSNWPFGNMDNFDNLDIPIFEEDPKTSSDDKNVSEKLFPNSIKWFPIDFDKICKNKTKKEPTCGKNKINIDRICAQIAKGASVKAFCSSENSSDSTASFRMTMRYMKESFIKNRTENSTKAKIEEKENKTVENKSITAKIEQAEPLKRTSRIVLNNTPLQLDSKFVNRRGSFDLNRYRL